MAVLTSVASPTCWAEALTEGGLEARSCVRRAVEGRAIPDELRDRALLVATELAVNGVRHAKETEVFARAEDGCIHVVVLDRGPGIPDVARALRNGVSSAGGLGVGLGAASRMSDQLDVLTDERGTAVHARIGAATGPAGWGALERAHPQSARTFGRSGDGWWVHAPGQRLDVLVVDALGHGAKAAEVTRRVFERLAPEVFDGGPADVLAAASDTIGTGRGCVGAALSFDRVTGLVRVAIVGNIAVRTHRVAGEASMLTGADGVLGARMPRPMQHEAPFDEDLRCLVATDGLSSREVARWRPAATPTLSATSAYRAARRGRDDALALAVHGGPWS